MKRLVTFLGTGNYEPVRYQWPEYGEYQSRFVVDALAELWRPNEVRVMATADARMTQEGAIRECLAPRGIRTHWVEQPDGRSPDEQWRQFELMRSSLYSPGADEVMLDITHGFRAQPFMTGAVLAIERALGSDLLPTYIVYGERAANGCGRIWSLDLFVDLLDWASALSLFRRTGVAGPLVALG